MNEVEGAPLTPHTGAVENSSMGLFFDIDKEGSPYPTIVISRNDKLLSSEFRTRLAQVDRTKLTMAWSINTAATDNESAEKGRVNVLAVEVNVYNGDQHAEDADEVLAAAALVPFTVMRTWLQHILDIKPSHVEVAFPDGSIIKKVRGGQKLEASFSGENDLVLSFLLDEEHYNQMVEDFHSLEESWSNQNSTVFDESTYEEEPMYVMHEDPFS